MEFQYPPHLRQGAYEEEGRCINTLKVGLSWIHLILIRKGCALFPSSIDT